MRRGPSPRGGAAEFEAFVVDHGPELVAFARRLTLDHHQAEDIVQDVLARLGLSWSATARIENLRAYAHKAVLNDFLSWRRRRSSTERPTSDLGERHAGAVPGVDDDVAQRLVLRGRLARLPPVQRAVLVLRYYDDKPDSQIADLLGCRESTVRSHARRGLAALRATGGGRPALHAVLDSDPAPDRGPDPTDSARRREGTSR